MNRVVPLLILLTACGGDADDNGDGGIGAIVRPSDLAMRSDGSVASIALDAATAGGDLATAAARDLASPSPEQACEVYTDCASCKSAICLWCGDNGGKCHALDTAHVNACFDLVPTCGGSGTSSGGGSCDANGTFVGASGADSCCSKTVDATGKCVAGGSSTCGACRSSNDCGGGEFCTFASGDPVGCCAPNNQCPSGSCVIDSDCFRVNFVCDQGCCWYAGP